MQEAPPKRRHSKKSPTNTNANAAEPVEAMQQAIALLAPLLEFHKPVEGATENDFRVYWDVRVVRGQDSPFAHVTGSSTLPGVLAPKMKALAPGTIQGEVMEKISRPLMAMFQDEMERQSLEEVAATPGDGEATPDSETAEHLP